MSNNRLDIQIRNAQRELAALKRGMFGGAKTYLSSQSDTVEFSGLTSDEKTLTLTFERPDFPMMFITLAFINPVLAPEIDPDNTTVDEIVAAGGTATNSLGYRSGRYEWKVPVLFGGAGGGSGFQMIYAARCTCVAEQIPAWSIT